MVKTLSTLLLAAFFTLVISCKKDHLPNNGELTGTWEWFATSGGFSGGGNGNPQSKGYTLRLELYEKGNYDLYKSDIKIEHGRLVIDQGLYTLVSDNLFPKNNLFDGEYIWYKNDTLSLGCGPGCADGISYLFEKRK